eukprot:scaffold7380_cov240-Pinguiococcus_pyrenoidosus.AAC.4
MLPCFHARRYGLALASRTNADAFSRFAGVRAGGGPGAASEVVWGPHLPPRGEAEATIPRERRARLWSILCASCVVETRAGGPRHSVASLGRDRIADAGLLASAQSKALGSLTRCVVRDAMDHWAAALFEGASSSRRCSLAISVCPVGFAAPTGEPSAA